MRNKILKGALIFLVLLSVYSLAVSEMEKRKKDDLFRQVELFSDTVAIIETDYVDETNPKDLIYGALKGMLSSLDAHSQFMDPDTYNELKIDTEGKFGGLGIEITIKDGLLTVVTPIEDTPAWRVGVKAGDRIVKIDNEITRDMTLTDAVKRMRGKPGTVLNITVMRESEKKMLEFKIVRDIIKIKDIKDAKILEDGIGYIRIVEFRENTAGEFASSLERLTRQGASALILDLRNNPGGLLDAAVRVAERFVDKDKLIVYTKSRKEVQDIKFVSRVNNPNLKMPMVVLINEGSASGSEIVAGCLQDYKRAIIVGVTSFGKGSVQTIIPLGDGSALRLTTSKYYTPLGKEIHGKGVIPDITVEEAKPASEEAEKEGVKESKDVFEQLEKKEKEEKTAKPLDYKLDTQLMRAMDILKALKFYNENNKK